MVKLVEKLHDLRAGLLVAVPGRLVGQYHRRIGDKRARDGDPLLLTAGKLVGLPLSQMGNLHKFQGSCNLGINLLFRQLASLQSVPYIFLDSEMGKNCVVLKQHTDVPHMCRQIVNQIITEIELTAFNGIKARNHTKQCGLATA
ncbi:hypothetical protein SDC9_165189 [bioreactor metagenome]|uniref:Uncharacterized protein n=1 Tax=bioreactor metagenome TaxID=1076179 RepID=A0A645G120_9ZZZZ